jgi:predicted PurR-regulated permease PerM
MKQDKLLYFTSGIILTGFFIYVLKTLQAIFIPLTFAIFFQLLFAPYSRFLETKKVPNFIIIFTIVAIIFISVTLVGSVVYASVFSFINDFPKYETKSIIYLNQIINKLELPIDDVKQYLTNKVNWLEIANRLSVTEIFSKSMGTFMDFIVKLLLTVIFLIFIIAERNKIFKRIAKVITPEEVSYTNIVIQKIEFQVKSYVINKTLISLATGLFGMFFVYIFGIDFVIVSGLLLFVLNFIPSIGSFVASAFPILICVIQYGFGWRFIGIAVLLGTLQTIMGNFIEPKLMGTELHLSPLIVLISLIFWFWVWGTVGMIIAIPITSALSLVIKEIKPLRVISAIISEE